MTNLSECKGVAVSFLYVDPQPNKHMPFLVDHPVFETRTLVDKQGMFDIFHEPERYREYVKLRREGMEKSDNAFRLMGYIRKAYRLYFFDKIKTYLSEEDYNELLRDTWTTIEAPSQCGISLSKLNTLFRVTKPELLMTEDDYRYWLGLPDEVIVYRGAADKRGISWSLSKERARWFADRFGDDNKVFEMTVSKQHTYGYLSDRREDEILVDVDYIK